MPDKSTGMYRKGGENMSEYKIITIGRQFGPQTCEYGGRGAESERGYSKKSR